MKVKDSSVKEQSEPIKNNSSIPAGPILIVLLLVVGLAAIFLSQNKSSVNTSQPQITFEQKMAHLETGAPLPGQNTKPDIPSWMIAMIFGFIVIQILPLLLASHKAKSSKLTKHDLRQIEFLAETPLHLGLLGSLLGVCMTHFLTGTLSAPLAYLTTISGILLYLFGRFTILLSLPSTNDIS